MKDDTRDLAFKYLYYNLSFLLRRNLRILQKLKQKDVFLQGLLN